MENEKLVAAFIGVDKALEVLRDEVRALRAENMMLKKRLREEIPPTRFCWLAETSDQSHRYLVTPGGELTADPWKATRFDTREKALEACSLACHRWLNLIPVEHGFGAEGS